MPDTVHHVMWYTVYDAKKKSLPVRQHGQAQRVMRFAAHRLDDITSERILQMKGILAEPGKAPVIASLPDSLWAIENRLGTPCEMIVMPRTPAVLFVGRYDGPIQPASLLNRKYRGRQLYGPILCYGWKGNNIQPMNKDVQTEMLDRLKGTEVRV